MKANAIKAFRYSPTGRIYLKGEAFDGSEQVVGALVRKGFLEAPSSPAAPAPAPERPEPESEAEAATEAQGAPALEAMTLRELSELCAEKGVAVPKKAKKSDLIALVEAVG